MAELEFDEVDVAEILARETKDGPGTDDLNSLPPSNFVSFAEPDVEKED
jgi:hypothetical protein